MSFFKTKSGEFFYTVQGEGEPIVILRGLGRSVSHWMNFDQYLAQNFKVICIDHRGIGLSKAKMSLQHSIYDLAADVVKLLDHLKIKKTHVMGVSLGGMITLGLALRFSNRLKKITVINASVGGFLLPRITPKALAAISGKYLDRKNFHMKLARVLTGSDLGEKALENLAIQWQTIEETEGFNVQAVLYQLLAAARFKVAKDLNLIGTPTQIILSKNDKFVPQSNSLKIAKAIPKSQFNAVENAGHEIFMDAPQKVRDLLVAFHLS